MTRAPRRRAREWVAWVVAALVLLIGLGGTAGAVLALEQRADNNEQAALERRADQVARAVDARLRLYRDLVENTAAMHATRPFDQLSLAPYLQRVALVRRYPGVTLLSLVKPATTAELPELARRLSAQRGRPVEINPAPGDEHYISFAIRRANGTDEGLGLDIALATEPTEALREAQRTGRTTLSAPYVLLIDRDLAPEFQQPSFLIAAPVTDAPVGRRGETTAWVTVGLRGTVFLSDVLRREAGDLQVDLVDQRVTERGGGRVVARAGRGSDSTVEVTDRVDALGRGWSLVARPGPDFSGRTSSTVPLVVAIAGTAVTLLLALVLALLITQRARALALVDRTTRKLAESEQKFRTIFAKAPVGLVDVGPDLSIRAANPRLSTILGCTPEELAGRPLPEIVHPEDRPNTTADVARIVEGGLSGYEAERTLVRSDGAPVPALVTMSAVRDDDGGLDGFLGSVFDETERVEARRALEAANAELAAANADLTGFAGVVAHDLKSPLVGINGFAQLLRKAYGGSLDARGLEFIRRIEEGVSRMSSLINDLLAYARAGTVEPELRETPLGDLVGSVAADLVGAIGETDAHVEFGRLPTLMVDELLVRQLFTNLIGNAVKYVDPSERPCVRVDSVDVGDVAVIRVTDAGIGIPDDQRDAVFVPFTRGAQAKDSYPGTGLGLAICARVVERHGGQIGVTATPGGGSSFWFTLQPSQLAPEDIPPATPPAERVRARVTG